MFLSKIGTLFLFFFMWTVPSLYLSALVFNKLRYVPTRTRLIGTYYLFSCCIVQHKLGKRVWGVEMTFQKLINPFANVTLVRYKYKFKLKIVYLPIRLKHLVKYAGIQTCFYLIRISVYL